jgi:hypothetical protein
MLWSVLGRGPEFTLSASISRLRLRLSICIFSGWQLESVENSRAVSPERLAAFPLGEMPAETGRPQSDRINLLRIYLSGYLNRIQSSRGLELEAPRNVELAWLTWRLMPDVMFSAPFTKDKGKAIRSVCR